MKAELKKKILQTLEKKNMEYLKDVLAYCNYMERIGDNKYLYFDKDMIINNADLFYVVEYDNDWFRKMLSKWYYTKDLAVSFYLDSKD